MFIVIFGKFVELLDCIEMALVLRQCSLEPRILTGHFLELVLLVLTKL
jgi:hypothetical protein